MALHLLENALRQRIFGLRERFPWQSMTLTSRHVHTHIRRDEESFLMDLFEDVFDEDDEDDDPYIERIENPFLWGRYVLQYEEMKARHDSRHVEEHIMIHATSRDSADKIAESNFDWRMHQKKKVRARFGRGVCFARHAEYAQEYASTNEVYIVAGVLVANSSEGRKEQILPELGDDTTTGNGENVYVKYYDNDFYPYYIVDPTS